MEVQIPLAADAIIADRADKLQAPMHIYRASLASAVWTIREPRAKRGLWDHFAFDKDGNQQEQTIPVAQNSGEQL